MIRYFDLVGMNAEQVREIFHRERILLMFEDYPGMYLMWTEDGQISMNAYAANGLLRSLLIDLSAASERPVDLPAGLKPEFTQRQVRRLLGEPRESKGVQIAPVIGERAAFDRFDVQGRVLEVAYRMDGSGILRVAILLEM